MANPVISRVMFEVGQSSDVMTEGGVVRKTSFLLALSALSAFALFFYASTGSVSLGMVQMISIISALVGLGLVITISVSPKKAKAMAIPYALIEGLFIGSASLLFAKFDPTIPMNALASTFVTAAVMLGLYKSGVIKVTKKFRSIIASAVIAIMLIYVAQILLNLVGSGLPYIFETGSAVSIIVSIFVVVIASLSLLLDFDSIERGVALGVSKDYEWLYSVGLLVTLVWMYAEIMRLLANFKE